MPIDRTRSFDASCGRRLRHTLADHRDERLLGAAAWLESEGMLGALPQFWDVQADGAGRGVPAGSRGVAAVDSIVGSSP